MLRLLVVTLTCSSFAVLADDYPKVIHRDQQVCVQSLDANGAVVEQCRLEGGERYTEPAQLTAPVGPPPPPPIDAPRAAAPRRAARLIEDDRGAARAIAELAGGQVVSLIPVLIAQATCNGFGNQCIANAVLAGLGSFVASSLVAGLLHLALEGRAGIGWAFLGNLIGGGLALLISVAAGASGSVAFAVVAGLIQVVLPSTLAAIALEVRDGTIRRRDAGLEALSPRFDDGLMAARF